MVKLPAADPLTVNELAQALDKNISTIFRWASPRGVRGQRLRLTRIGGRTYVRRLDFESFLAAINRSSTPGGPKEQSSVDGIDHELDAAGL